jgi:hypothetical protein
MISASFDTVDNNEAEPHEAGKCSGLVSYRNTVPNLPASPTSHHTSLSASRFPCWKIHLGFWTTTHPSIPSKSSHWPRAQSSETQDVDGLLYARMRGLSSAQSRRLCAASPKSRRVQLIHKLMCRLLRNLPCCLVSNAGG